jgi:hypothetical protein
VLLTTKSLYRTGSIFSARKPYRALVAEEKVRADPHLRNVKPVDQDRPDEHLRIPQRQVVGEADHGDPLHPGAGQRFDLLLLRHEERRRLVGPQHAGRMGVEGHRRRRPAAFPGAPPHAIDDLHVAAVQPVEIAQREHRLVPPWRRVVRKMGNVHR